MRAILLSAAFLLYSASQLASQETKPAATAPVSSAEMKRLFDEDQAVRQPENPAKINWATVNQQDAVRREATRKLIDTGALHTGVDFEKAAFIFQHGDTADDYLYAHTLAMIAVVKGQASALWIVTATLDRYLNKIGQPQVYGTQFHRQPEAPWTQEPYNRTLISDELRHTLGVPNLAAQENRLEQMKAMK